MKKIFFALLCSVSSFFYAQEIKSYTWAAQPTFKEIPKEFQDSPAVVVLDRRWIHTRVGSYAYASFIMNHFAIKINKADEINKYNKVKAEERNYTRDVRDFHARIIKPNGQINVLPPEKIIETEVEKTKQIVFEGVEAGDILEYYYILKENPAGDGLEIFQKEIPVIEAEFITSGSGVYFDIYESPAFTKDFRSSKNRTYATNLKPYKTEPYARNLNTLEKIIFVANVPGTSSYYNWSTHLSNMTKKQTFWMFKKTQARDFIEKLNVGGLPLDEKLQKIDLYIKENFEFANRGEKLNKIKDLNNGKLKLSSSDLFDLYNFVFKELEIPYSLVVGVDRFVVDMYDTLVPTLPYEYLFYFPETKKFISPFQPYVTYGYPIDELQNTKTYKYEVKRSSSAEKFMIPTTPASFTQIVTNSTLKLSDDLTEATIEKEMQTTGYRGQYDRYAYKYYKENEDEKELNKYLKNIILDEIDCKILDYKYENTELIHSFTNTPLTIKAKIKAIESFTEDAGNLLMVNLGKVIGKQSNLYQETERINNIDLNYAKGYKHKIIFEIPAGYEVESLADLNITKKMTVEEAKASYFVSKASVQNNIVTVEVDEQYNDIHYPKEKYNEYRDVMNASFDFSKASIVLRKK